MRGYALAYEAFPDGGIDGRADRGGGRWQPRAARLLRLPHGARDAGRAAAGRRRRAAPFTEAAEVVCVDGAPTGELRESGAIGLVMRGGARRRPTRSACCATGRRSSGMNAVGLTGAHVMIGSPQLYEVLPRDGRARLADACGCVVPLHQEPDISDDEIAARLPLLGARGRLWRGGTAKFFIDGVVETGTAWLYEPDTNGGGTRAVLARPRSATRPSVARFARAGFACTTHAVGDRAVRAALDAYRAAGAAPAACTASSTSRRCRTHDLPRFAAEGVVRLDAAAPHGEQLGRPADPWSRALGPERSARAFRTRDLGHRRARLPRLRLAGGAVRSAAAAWAGAACGASPGIRSAAPTARSRP